MNKMNKMEVAVSLTIGALMVIGRGSPVNDDLLPDVPRDGEVSVWGFLTRAPRTRHLHRVH